MRKVCAWCKEEMGPARSAPSAGDVITHGICEPCFLHVLEQEGLKLQHSLDGLGVPVLLMEGDVNVRTGNRFASRALGKTRRDLEGHKSGNVIECIHAKTPEGCGKTAHCRSCVIRKTVKETFATGKSFVQVPAHPHVDTPAGVKHVCLRISTEKVGDHVLLRIDDIGDSDEK